MAIRSLNKARLDTETPIFDLFKKYKSKRVSRPLKQDVQGENNIIENNGSNLKTCTFEIWGDNNTIVIGENCLLNHVTFHIEGNNQRVEIGNDVAFNIAGSIWMEDHDCNLTIGAQSTFENVHLAVTEPYSTLSIGKDCMFSYDIDVRTGDSHSVIEDSENKRTNYAENISFGDHVWVASHCVILKGARIGSNSIIGTRCVVTKPFPQEGVVLGGNPAKVIKKGINWKRERVYDKK